MRTPRDTPLTVADLVRRFELRRRAASDAFAAGVELAVGDAVRLHSVGDRVVTASVDPGCDVELAVDGSTIVGHCSCGEPSPCRHQVAVAHALWVRDWRPGYSETGTPHHRAR